MSLDYEKEWKKFVIKLILQGKAEVDPKNDKLKLPIYHTTTKNIWIKSNQGGYNLEKKEKGYWETTFTGFKLGRIGHRYCQYCTEPLTEEQKRREAKFCNSRHRKEYHKIQKIRMKLGAEFIVWSKVLIKTSEGLEKQVWKDGNEPTRNIMQVKIHGKTRPLTKFKSTRKKSESA